LLKPSFSAQAAPAHVAEDPLSHTRHWNRSVVQEVAPSGVLDLGPGYLEPGLMPGELLRRSYVSALDEYGAAALGYGSNRGALPFRAAIAARTAAADGAPCDPDHVLVTAGTSQALHLLATTLAAPGDTVLIDTASYDLGTRILTDCGLRPRTVADDADGMDPGELEHAITAVRGGGSRIAFLYLNPTYHNPTGRVVPLARRRELLAVTARHGVLVVEDDAYTGLGLGPEAAPPSLAALAGHRDVVRLGTFSKTLAPGLRLGWLVAEPAFVERIAAHALFVSGGSLNHLASLAVTRALVDGGYDQHLGELRTGLTARRDALVGALRAGLDDRIEFATPPGGLFLWLRSRDGHSEAGLLTAAEQAGVSVAAGSRFGTAAQPTVRLAYSFNPPETLERAARLLTRAWRAPS